MSIRLFIYFFLLTFTHKLTAQVHPTDQSTVNYRLIGFSFPSHQSANNYRIDIAMGDQSNDDSFKSQTIATYNTRLPKLIAEVPAFGTKYTWRVTYTEGHAKTVVGPMYHFSTGYIPSIDTNNIKLRITKNLETNAQYFVFLDGTKVLYDMTGRPIWYLPTLGSDINAQCDAARDLKISNHNTITLLSCNDACEINYDGRSLWRGPNDGRVSSDTQEYYHHEFTHLSNGNYMVMGNEMLNAYAVSRSTDDSLLFLTKRVIPKDSGRLIAANVNFGTIIEYDRNGSVIWTYKTSKYFNGSDLLYVIKPGKNVDPHDNAFYFDENRQFLYISYKNIDRVVKIKYPEGTVVGCYGEIFKPVNKKKTVGSFCQQHSCKVSEKGYLYLFNNNGCHNGAAPTVVVMKETDSAKNKLEKVWEFPCPVDIKTNAGGGNVIELPDQSFFVSTCGPYNLLFIVNLDKNILWSALSERWNPDKKQWEPLNHYRASIISSREALENLIWNK